MKIVYDGDGARVGRIGSVVAKELLKGKEVFVINSENAVVSGSKKRIIEKIQAKRAMGRGGSMKGPKISKLSDRLLKRMIRGMLPWDRTRGREAFKRLRCFVGNGGLKEEDLKEVKKFNSKMPLKFF